MLCPRCGSDTPPIAGRCENCGLALIETHADIDRKGPYHIGDVANERYEIRERVPSGPLYWTYVAFDQEEERSLFLRVVRQTILPRSRDHDAFVGKIEPLRSLVVPGVSNLLRTERDEGKTLVISEFVDGLSLRSLIDLRRQDSRAFSASETLSVLAGVAEALEATKKVTAHGDLRPSHILILDETLKIEACGLAAALPPEETIRALKDDPEAIGYLAPEVLDGQLGDPLSDIYSFAIMAGELLSGRVPPAQGVGMDEFVEHLPPLSVEVLGKSLSSKKKERADSFTEIVAGLSAVLGAETWSKQKKKSALTSAQPAFSKDPSVPAEPDESGTIPMASPFETQNYQPPSPGALASPKALTILGDQDVDETQKNNAAAAEQAAVEIVGKIEKQTENDTVVSRDPRISVQPAAEGTVQITADMLEPDSQLVALVGEDKAKEAVVELVESQTPAVSEQSPAESTVQITEDMLETVDDEDVDTDPRAAKPKKHQSPAEVEGSEAPQKRGEGLDPKLVRAAQHLDKQRKGTDSVAEDEENITTTIHRHESDADEVILTPRSTPAEKPPRHEAPRLERVETVEAMEETVREESPPDMVEPPSALLKGSIGPIDVKVAGGNGMIPSIKSEPRSPDEPQALPAVMVDQALTEAFGHAEAPLEATHRVKRYKAPSPQLMKSSKPPNTSIRWGHWVLFIVLLTGMLTLLGLGSLWLLD